MFGLVTHMIIAHPGQQDFTGNGEVVSGMHYYSSNVMTSRVE